MKLTPSAIVARLSGTSGDVVAASWKGRQYVRTRVVPFNPQTDLQIAVRNSMTETVALWQRLSAVLKLAYGIGAKPMQYSGCNDFVKLNRAPLQAATGLFGPRLNLDSLPPAEGEQPRIAIPQDVAAVAGVGDIDVTWTDPDQFATNYLGFLLYDTTDDEFAVEILDAALHSAEAYTLTPLTAAHVYVGCAFSYREEDNEMCHAATFTATPTA